MSRIKTNCLSMAAVALAGVVPGSVLAQVPSLTADNVTVRAGLSLQHDDNFLRAPAATAVSELVSTQSVGINVRIPVSLQRFEFDVGITNNKYSDFSSFDYMGKNFSAAWRWSFTPQLHGNVISTRVETLNAPLDSVNPTLRNRNATTTHGFDATYELGGPWQLMAGYSRSNSLNEQPLIGEANERSSTYNLGARYAMASGNSIAYNLRHDLGTNPNNYTGITHDLSGVWIVSGNTTLTGHLAHLNREYSTTPQFDYDGFAGGISAVWRATGKITVNANWQRELESYQTATTTNALIDTITFGPVWQITPITSISGLYRYAIRRDKGSPAGLVSSRKDNTQEASITYNWQPRPFVSLNASLARLRRTSNVAGLGYSDNLVTLSAQFNF